MRACAGRPGPHRMLRAGKKVGPLTPLVYTFHPLFTRNVSLIEISGGEIFLQMSTFVPKF